MNGMTTMSMNHGGGSMSSMNHSAMANQTGCGGMMMGGMNMSGMANCTSQGRGMSMSMDMKMFFHFGVEETILFKGWKTDTAGELFGSMLAVAFMAFLFEVLRVLHLKLSASMVKKRWLLPRQKNSTKGAGDKEKSAWSTGKRSNNSESSSESAESDVSVRLIHQQAILQTLLKMARFGLGYVLMLVIMTYNVWLYFAVIAGFGAGFAVFYNYTKRFKPSSGSEQSTPSSQRALTMVELDEKAQPASDHMY